MGWSLELRLALMAASGGTPQSQSKTRVELLAPQTTRLKLLLRAGNAPLLYGGGKVPGEWFSAQRAGTARVGRPLA